MSVEIHRIRRPLWRAYGHTEQQQAVDYVRSGGHVLLFGERFRNLRPWSKLLLPVNDKGELPELTYWAILALELNRWKIEDSGITQGLATVRIDRNLERIVMEWCTRDSHFKGSFQDIELDCTQCGKCCLNPRVLLEPTDFDRWRNANREDLTHKDYLRTVDGKVMLNLTERGRCVHQRPDYLCGIYPIRPEACSVFIAGSEGCLTARARVKTNKH